MRWHLWSSFFLASASRLAQVQMDLAPVDAVANSPDEYRVSTFISGDAEKFLGSECTDTTTKELIKACVRNPGWKGVVPAIFPYLKYGRNSPLTVTIKEIARTMKTNHFTWHGPDGDFGRITSEAMTTKKRLTMKQNGERVLRFRQNKQNTNKPTFFVTAPEGRILYTIRKFYNWGGSDAGGADKKRRKNGLLLDGSPEKKYDHGHRQYMQIFLGGCTRPEEIKPRCSQDWPIYEAVGERSKKWDFYRNSHFGGDRNENATAKKVAQLTNPVVKRTARGNDKTFELEILDETGTHTDVGALMAAVSVASLHQNGRDKGQWTNQASTFGLSKLAAERMGGRDTGGHTN